MNGVRAEAQTPLRKGSVYGESGSGSKNSGDATRSENSQGIPLRADVALELPGAGISDKSLPSSPGRSLGLMQGDSNEDAIIACE